MSKNLNQLRYYLNGCLMLPLYPLLSYQGQQVRKNIPQLPPPTDFYGSIKGNKPNRQILLIGESTIAGIGVDTHEKGIAGAMAKALAQSSQRAIQWQVLAQSGFTAAMVFEKLIPKLPPPPIDQVVIGLGANDAFRATPPKTWRKNIRQIIEGIRAQYPKADIIFSNMPPVRDFPALSSLLQFFLGRQIDLIGNELAEVVKEFSGAYLIPETFSDLVSQIERERGQKFLMNDLFSDGVHPSQKTYQIWGESVAQFILSLEK